MANYQSIAVEESQCERSTLNGTLTPKRARYSSNQLIACVIISSLSFGFALGYFFSRDGARPRSAHYGIVKALGESNILDEVPFERSTSRAVSGVGTVEFPYDMNLTSVGNDLLYLSQAAAFERFLDVSTLNSDYFLYESGLDAQVNQAYCAVATIGSVMNSFRFRHDFKVPMDAVYSPYPYATQHDLFNACTHETVVSDGDGLLKSPGGLTLDQAARLLKCHTDAVARDDDLSCSWEVSAEHVDPKSSSVDSMRTDMVRALEDEGSRVVVNYHRAALGQVGGGHFSPIGAYHPPTDSFLILDVAKYKYPPVWAPAEKLFESLATVDKCGTWDYPSAQERLFEEHVDKYDYKKKMEILGCEESYRGYLIVSSRKAE